ncbi:hypothetical protein AcV7_002842 [Taiwanofungus camphoratus]|nr:hypothetical protein AcV7_002842 [Antrodia cinnamomea]
MPEYVYVLHEFTPENPDEVPLKVGERIEVVEKDDLYGDGWWQGRNAAGKVGLFPQSYTSSNPPASSVAFPADKSPSLSSDALIQATIVPSSSSQPPHEQFTATLSSGDSAVASPSNDLSNTHERTLSQGDGEVMKATMTDVQKAIEQLGRSDHDGSRSFSFTSSHGGSTDHSDADSESDADNAGGFGWSKGARTKLALRAQQANAERAAKEREVSAPGTPLRSLAPPIDFEMSDESEGEEDELLNGRSRSRSHSPRRLIGDVRREYPQDIPEEDEDDHGGMNVTRFATHPPVITLNDHGVEEPSASISQRKSGDSVRIVPSEEFIVPSPVTDETQLPTARPERIAFHESDLSPSVASAPEPSSSTLHDDLLSPEEDINSAPPSMGSLNGQDKAASPPPASLSASASASALSVPQTITQTISLTPSTIKAATQLPFAPTSAIPSPTASYSGSTGPSSADVQQTSTPATTVMSFKTSTGAASQVDRTFSVMSDGTKRPDGHPSEWTVEQVVEWLRSKGFDQDICDKFTEQEITGDVLLELDANVLKTEIGIAAFGKRARIVNAITELGRPPSVFEAESPARVTTPRSQSHSLNHSYHTHSHSASMQSSAQTQASWAYSPLYPPSGHGFSPGVASVTSMDGGPHTGELPGSSNLRSGWPAPENEERMMVGLGLGLPASPSGNGKDAVAAHLQKPRPAQLVLSPSDSALGSTTAFSGSRTPITEEDRGAMSESETTLPSDAKAKHRRLFWRSSETSSLKEKPSSLADTTSRHSKDTSTPTSAPSASSAFSAPASATTSPNDVKSDSGEGITSVVRRVTKKRESVDGHKTSDHRLSLFGGTFPGTIGKARKPPPRLSAGGEKSDSEKHTHGTFSRIRDIRSSGRPSTADGTKDKEKKAKDIPLIKDIKEAKRSSSEKNKEKSPKEYRDKDSKEGTAVLRKRTTSMAADLSKGEALAASQLVAGAPRLKVGQSIMEQIGTPDHEGWMRKKGERYNTWKTRYFVLKGPHLYYLRNNSKSETKIKGYINISGYKVVADENVDPGRYGFRITHDTDKTHYFSSEEQGVIREWMKALMKATISRDYTDLVVSSCNIPTIPLTVAQAMNPAPRPPSPTARAATQRAMRPENPNQLTQRDAQVLLMGVPAKDKGVNAQHAERTRLESFFTNDTLSTNGTEPASKKPVSPKTTVPPRPSRELRRLSSQPESSSVDTSLIDWANSHLPGSLQVTNPSGPLFNGLALLRLAEDIKGKPSAPQVPDSAFPSSPDDDKLDGLFRLFDFLLDNDVKMGTVSINDIRQGKREKIAQLLRALKAWEDKKKVIAQSLGRGSAVVTQGPNSLSH